ncbi:PepSY-associated TM helix domain-containing protein [Pseudomonas sp. P1B16]|uniref:PepSY-associated TM helix domain-containing protein n=1 Tax=Pseudomonas TaxID=286 RepID=UPI0004D6CFE5|nr:MULTISPECIES: PepSY-associated TM helix domain-containing protein [Pseudomonas]KEY85581.1 peptidase [Pseudomonas capeferrum]KGI93587.1 peptidase [Pseudomonas sp. H2]MCH7297949.1 PepSY domain-containing protein [Pseudomonas capeferrum]MDD2063964.1 PepSY domain-containing protein [Pseudomonas sp. 25571]UDU80520.1 PepSY domain-containing protein [Pseudomonas sp. HN2-3]
MKEGFRQAMAWLHTWTGLIFGWLLFAIFLTGTLSYFKEEINHWSQPEVRRHALDPVNSLGLAQRYLEANAAHAGSWMIRLPNAREAALSVSWRDPEAGRRGFVSKSLDAQTGQPVEARDSRGGEFFYRFHFQLEMPYPFGRWLSTFCAFIMLVGLVTGIITHKKIFKEFFTFRPGKGQRSWLDGHNAIGVLVLPFHLMISYSSLVLFMYMVMPAGILASYSGNTGDYFNELFGRDDPPKAANVATPLVPLPTLYAKVQEQVPGARIGYIQLHNPGDSNAQVTFTQASADNIAYKRSAKWTFDGTNGALLSQGAPESGAMATAFSFAGLHMGNFAGPWLRWLYFVFGVAGTAVIGTGLVMWLGKRQLKHAKSEHMPSELRLVEVLNIASMSGLLLAVAGFFWANRLVPVALEGRADWEVNAFFLAWLLSLVHAVLRPGRRAWGEQLALGALAFALLPLVNGLTTGQGLDHSLQVGDWAMAGFDLTALAVGLFLAWAASKMLRAPKPVAKRASRAAKKPTADVVEVG